MPEVDRDDPVMVRVREHFSRLKEASGWTLHQLGIGMGYDESVARKAAFQFLQGKVPRIDTLRKFADAVGVPLAELVTEPKSKKKKAQPG